MDRALDGMVWMGCRFESCPIRKNILKMKLIHGDCLIEMRNIPDKSVDAIICDLPYSVLNKGNKSAQWDNIIPFEPLWKQYERVIKDNGAIVLFAQGMFTAQLMMSNPKLWRYNLIWDKKRATGFLNANRMPMRYHEDIVVFYKKLPTYNPQMEDLNGREPNHTQGNGDHNDKNQCYGKTRRMYDSVITDKKHPRSIIAIPAIHCNEDQSHPTQKPISLMEYLIKTYTNEGESVLDNTMGSGTTGVACVNTNRDFIGIEKEKEYYDIACERIAKAQIENAERLF